MTRARLNDPVFQNMKVVPGGTLRGGFIVICKCQKLRPLIRQPRESPHRDRRGTYATVSSLAEARDWAWDHLHSPDHWTA